MSIIHAYLDSLLNPKLEPCLVHIPKKNISKNNSDTIFRMAMITSLLKERDIHCSFAGTGSVILKIPFSRSVHDVDTIVAQRNIPTTIEAFQNAGYDFWQEDYVHHDMRHMSGGMGRHHNYGASIPNFLQDNGLPVWTGIFTYQEKDGGIEFYENFAISAYKVQLLLSRLEKNQHINSLQGIDVKEIDYIKFDEITRELTDVGIDFWHEINNPYLSVMDIDRRNYLSYTERCRNLQYLQCKNKLTGEASPDEEFFEVKMTTWYPISADEYLFADCIRYYEKELFSIPLEVAYLRFKDPRFYPHFLGARDKYLTSGILIEGSSKLDKMILDRFREVYEHRQVVHTVLSKYKFTHDATFDWHIIRRQLDNRMRAESGEPNYLTFLLEGTHYRQ